MERILMGFRGMRFVLHVRRLGEMKINFKNVLSENLKAVIRLRLKE
jgi:hypothetical protein